MQTPSDMQTARTRSLLHDGSLRTPSPPKLAVGYDPDDHVEPPRRYPSPLRSTRLTIRAASSLPTPTPA
eukprot:CAMPEP_0196772672 /NCGR_PEP_ID=MMETSP1104-20130614/2359_1 /TAXON_ID=33652 /ORGANISM="Cafeteria sp., Strain Caron Lab Isolate" /LENGTH=68 /DNA_ID=CAMNT_0042142809 /DNA_START=57 /DNA_END=260 /DNA_ORIENTATION=-